MRVCLEVPLGAGDVMGDGKRERGQEAVENGSDDGGWGKGRGETGWGNSKGAAGWVRQNKPVLKF